MLAHQSVERLASDRFKDEAEVHEVQVGVQVRFS